MGTHDSVPGGHPRNFPTTIWSDILVAGDASSPRSREKMDQLFRAYWKPVYAYIRTAWRKRSDDAQDLTQAFFAHILQRGYMSRLRPERGSFRGYLKRALKHFLIDAERAEAVRRPANPVISLDATPKELARLQPAAPDEPPEKAYDREWFRCLMDQSIQALKESLAADGKAVYFEVFRIYCADADPSSRKTKSTVFGDEPEAAPTYRDVAGRLGLQESDVRNYLSYCRRTIRQILKERIRGYVASESEVETELQEFLNG